MGKIFGYGKNDIPYINRLKRLSFYLVVIIVFVVNVFLSTSLNLKNISDNLINNSKLIVDLKHNIDEVNKNNLERDIIENPGVIEVRFIDKRESFRKLQDDLSISIPESSNPLYDSVLISVKNKEDINKIREKLESLEEVKEVYVNDLYLNERIDKGNIYNVINMVLAAVMIMLAISCIFIFKLLNSVYFLNRTNISKNYKQTLSNSKKRSILNFASSSLIGTLIFFNVYVYIRNNIIPKDVLYQIFSLKEIFIYNLAALVILNLIIIILPASIFNIVNYEKGTEKENDSILFETEVNE